MICPAIESRRVLFTEPGKYLIMKTFFDCEIFQRVRVEGKEDACSTILIGVSDLISEEGLKFDSIGWTWATVLRRGKIYGFAYKWKINQRVVLASAAGLLWYRVVSGTAAVRQCGEYNKPPVFQRNVFWYVFKT